jgi:hypothetical protein
MFVFYIKILSCVLSFLFAFTGTVIFCLILVNIWMFSEMRRFGLKIRDIRG